MRLKGEGSLLVWELGTGNCEVNVERPQSDPSPVEWPIGSLSLLLLLLLLARNKGCSSGMCPEQISEPASSSRR
jgi:hypothetical protein